MAVNTLNQNKNFTKDARPDIPYNDTRSVNLVFVPYWIRDEIVKNKFSLKELLSFKRVRELFSYNDLIDLICLNARLKDISGIQYFNTNNDFTYIYSFDKDYSEFADDYYKHFDTNRINNLRDRFDKIPSPVYMGPNDNYFPNGEKVEDFPKDPNEEIRTELAYSVNIMTSTTVLVVAERSFFSRLGDSGELNKFFAECLKAMYGIAPIHEVNRTSFFRAYLNTL